MPRGPDFETAIVGSIAERRADVVCESQRKSGPEFSQDNRSRSDGSRFCPQNRGSQGSCEPARLRELTQFVGGPTAFRADRENDALTRGTCTYVLECRFQGELILGFSKHNPAGRQLIQHIFEFDGFCHFRRSALAGLFSRLTSDALPALPTLQGSRGQMWIRPTGHNWSDPGHSQLGAFFDGPFHPVELEYGEEEIELWDHSGRQLFP